MGAASQEDACHWRREVAEQNMILDAKHSARGASSDRIIEDVDTRVVALNVTRLEMGQLTTAKLVTRRVGLSAQGTGTTLSWEGCGDAGQVWLMEFEGTCGCPQRAIARL